MAHSKSIHFFATKRDLESVLTNVESKHPVKYTQAGMFDTQEIPTFMSGSQIPDLGLAPTGEQPLEPFWLVTDALAKVEVEQIPQRGGGVRYGVDPELNPESVVFWPGGVFEDCCAIAGRISTTMMNSISIQLVNLFAREIRRHFTRIKSYYVGPEAEQLLDAGYRLTASVKSPRDTDLSKDPATIPDA